MSYLGWRPISVGSSGSSIVFVNSIYIYLYYLLQVIHIEITRPKTFDFQPGDYLYLQIPHISPYEFHPFTISSAPEMKGMYNEICNWDYLACIDNIYI